LGRRKASGITLLALVSLDSEGGLGFAVYSVRARPVFRGVRGVITPLVLVSGVFGRE
jgi:hypothetical protein